jgi:hypothetical protein
LATRESQQERVDRLRAIREAEKRKDIPFLVEALDDPDWRANAVMALGDLGATDTVPEVTPLLEDDDAEVRLFAAQALGRLGGVEAAPRLRDLAFEDENERVRMWAATALAELGDPEAVRANVALLSMSSMWIRANGAYQLEYLGDPQALGALEAAQPKFLESPRAWAKTRGTFRCAISGLRRRAAGKAPRTWRRTRWARWSRKAALVALFAVAVVVLRQVMSVWLAVPLVGVAVIALSYLVPAWPPAKSPER